MADKITDRVELMRQMKLEPPPAFVEVSRLFNPGSVAFALMGHMLRTEDENLLSLLNVNLTTQDGQATAAREQGRLKGRREILDYITDLIMEGNDDGGSGTGNGSGPDDTDSSRSGG